MSSIVLSDPVIQSVSCPAQRHQANLALRCVLDAEIEGLKARLRQRSANAAAGCDQARADWDRQIGWLRDSLAKLQARRLALC